MALPLKQSTASQEVILGPFLDDTDGKTAETGLTIANTDIKIWVEGGTSEASKNSGGATHIASGRYYAVLDATDTATLGKMEINVHVSGALPVRREFIVYPANVFDALFAGSDTLEVDVTQFGGSNGTFASGRPEVNTTHAAGTAWGSGAITAGVLAADAITAAKVAADVSAEIADAVWDEALAGHLSAGSTGEALDAAGSGSAPSAADVADAVWDEARAGHVGAGSFGEGVVVDSVATAAVNAAALDADAIEAIADGILSRDIDNVEGTAAIHSLCSAILKAVAKVTRASNIETTYRTDGTTAHMEQTLTPDGGAEPVIEQTGATAA